MPVRYLQWLGGALHGDLGTSLTSNEPVACRIAQRCRTRCCSAARRWCCRSWSAFRWASSRRCGATSLPDFVLAAVSVLGLSIPAFWFGIMLILTFSVNLQWLPSSGVCHHRQRRSTSSIALQHLVMPALVLSTTVLPYVVRFTRSALLEVLHQDYVRTATAKGLSRSAWSSTATRCATRWCR